MKTLAILAALALMGCSPATDTPLVINEIHVNSGSEGYRYAIYVNHTGWCIFTDKKYNVGDTIK